MRLSTTDDKPMLLLPVKECLKPCLPLECSKFLAGDGVTFKKGSFFDSFTAVRAPRLRKDSGALFLGVLRPSSAYSAVAYVSQSPFSAILWTIFMSFMTVFCRLNLKPSIKPNYSRRSSAVVELFFASSSVSSSAFS